VDQFLIILTGEIASQSHHAGRELVIDAAAGCTQLFASTCGFHHPSPAPLVIDGTALRADRMDRFKQAGHGETAESWVGTGPNKPVTPPQLEQAIGPEVLETLSKQTGLSREEVLARLSRELPDAVDKYTPHGRLPTEADPPRS